MDTPCYTAPLHTAALCSAAFCSLRRATYACRSARATQLAMHQTCRCRSRAACKQPPTAWHIARQPLCAGSSYCCTAFRGRPALSVPLRISGAGRANTTICRLCAASCLAPQTTPYACLAGRLYAPAYYNTIDILPCNGFIAVYGFTTSPGHRWLRVYRCLTPPPQRPTLTTAPLIAPSSL